MAVVVFDPTAFKARYPEFASVANATLSAIFPEACLYLNNTDRSPVGNVTRRALLLNMLVAHIGSLGGLLSADGQPKPVGRISSASEGSVSASLDYAAPGTLAWYNQTQYGAAFIQATSAIRSFRYVSCPTTF
jgi:hypothetical protein